MHRLGNALIHRKNDPETGRSLRKSSSRGGLRKGHPDESPMDLFQKYTPVLLLALIFLGVIINLQSMDIETLIGSQAKFGSSTERGGFMVLGMHRSGTSALTGLLYRAAGYNYGAVTRVGKNNQKGFYERYDTQAQNVNLMQQQGMDWDRDVLDFDWQKGLKARESGKLRLEGSKHFLKFIQNPKSVPWLQKDPRMCITLKWWLKVMGDNEPAIVFTYRHPLESAMSLNKRNSRLSVQRGLRLWSTYNMRAIQNSEGLCMVRTSYRKIMADPVNEVQRISDDLTTKCNVPSPGHRVKANEVGKFVSLDLQHNRAEDQHEGQKILESFNDGTCVAYDYESKEPKGSEKFELERKCYLTAMKIFCDLESGKAFRDDYVWPKV